MNFLGELVTIWQQILQWENIGINRTFFDLGGDSLSVVKCLT